MTEQLSLAHAAQTHPTRTSQSEKGKTMIHALRTIRRLVPIGFGNGYRRHDLEELERNEKLARVADYHEFCVETAKRLERYAQLEEDGFLFEQKHHDDPEAQRKYVRKLRAAAALYGLAALAYERTRR